MFIRELQERMEIKQSKNQERVEIKESKNLFQHQLGSRTSELVQGFSRIDKAHDQVLPSALVCYKLWALLGSVSIAQIVKIIVL